MRLPPFRLPVVRRDSPVTGAVGISAAALLLFSVSTGCADRSTEIAARDVLARYQTALFEADRPALRRLLSSESRDLIERIPLERVEDKQPLEFLEARSNPPEVLVTVADPNDGGAEKKYVLVKEQGELRVDLLATTAYHSYDRPTVNNSPRFTSRDLPQEELARIRSRYATAFR